MNPTFVNEIRKEFPALHQKVHGKPLVYLDNAATSLKPKSVIEATENYYMNDCANVHRGLHTLSQRASTAFEFAREKVQSFIHAKAQEEIIFVRGTTEAINLVAHSFLAPKLSPGDEILITQLEHHANIVPWQMVAEKTGAKVVAVPVNDHGDIEVSEIEKRISSKTKMFAMTHISNTLGTLAPIDEMIRIAKKHHIPTLVDGAQAVAHQSIDVQQLDCDFYCFSGHKMCGPTGIGVLYGKKALLNSMEPYQGGGAMIDNVTIEKTTFIEAPFRFEAGTPHIAGAIGLGAAIDFLNTLDMDEIHAHETQISQYAKQELSKLSGIQLIGNPKQHVPVFSFIADEMHPQDIGTLLDMEGVAIRTGHHCTQPLLKRFGLHATARASFAFYNTHEEVDRLISALQNAKDIFSVA